MLSIAQRSATSALKDKKGRGRHAEARAAAYLQAQGYDAAIPRAYFNVNTGVIGTVQNSPEAVYVQSLGGGWVACYLQFNVTTTVSGKMRIILASADNDQNVLFL